MYCTEVLVTLLGLFGALSDSAHEKLCPLTTDFAPLVTALSDAPQQIMVHSSNQRHKGTLGFRGKNLQFARIFAPL